ncbi:tRNA pseudouridine(38-40) synthase TruA [Bacillus sp. PS06]|uniref:tRNA pseudouridine(38-40) synthase TruA n=1 Tax=Bacillus sp. PS06 TaxID=2764176 RepID=UPI00177ABDD0|nr:tRNA pseudouridine(38-40) synthase TruA [Bacillus sp. PS06]MBD8070919.1 tRNA pseudouridine(38-40) synthase TruA [Bacillus sp. PS06]
MKRLKCTIAYDGTSFFGYQIQPNKRSVQETVESILSKMHKCPIHIVGSGRTDAKVHAVGQVIHFDTPLDIAVNRWKKALNSLLPEDIVVHNVEEVSTDFHARFNVVKKEYRYKLSHTPTRDVFNRHYAYHYPYQLDLESIKEAMRYLIGTHDFTSFCSAKTEVKDKVRTLYQVELLEERDEYIFRFVGNGFLYNMVRILVGTLLEVGQGKIKPQDIQGMLLQQDRSLAGKTAPGHGLYLWKVTYDN